MKRVHLRFSAIWSTALLLAGFYLPAHAQQDPDDAQRGVARVSLMNGQVSVQRGDSGEWVAGIVNAPLITGDRVATGPNSRAEVQFDSSNLFRLGANAEVHLTQLATGRYQMEFGKGILTYRVLRPSDATEEVDTPSVAVRPSRLGAYRIAVNDAGETEVAARSGSVDVFSPKGSQTVNAGQMLIARGDPSDPEYQIVGAPAVDEWDRWNDTRDHAIMQATSAQYVGDGVYGTEDLDGQGTWSNVDGYGYCWHPNMPVDWAPYQAGRWVWLDWYGWTWVSYDSWGWAPYHYGRWFYQANYGWLWYPGVRGVRHYWSPAMVAFFGYGGVGFGVGFGFGFGNVGWVPLAPYEVFYPWWGRSYYGGFNRGINVTSVNITSVYRNARVAGGVSSLSAEDFRNGRFSSIGRPGAEQLRSAGVIRGQVGIAPSHANLQYAAHAATFTPRTSANTRFFTHQQPAAVARVPFSQQQHSLEQGSRPAGTATAGRSGAVPNDRPATAGSNAARPGQGGQSTPMNRPNGAGTGAATPAGNGNNGGFRRFGDPGAQSGGQGSNSGAGQNTRPAQPPSGQSPSGGDRRFGSPGSSTQNTRPGYTPPSNNSPQSRPSQPSYSAPRPAPSYTPPPSTGGGGGSTKPPGAGSSGHPSTSGGGRKR